MKIAFINQSYPPMISGASIVVERLANAMSNRGHASLVIAASDIGKAYTTEKDNQKVVRLASFPNPKRANQRFVPSSYMKIVREVKDFQPDIIHIHDLLAMGVAGIHAGKFLKIPVVGTIHALPWIISMHLSSNPKLKNNVENSLWLYSRWLNSQCEQMIVPTQTIAKTVDSMGGFQPIAISNGVDLNRFTPTGEHAKKSKQLYKRLGLDPRKPVILHVGRLDLDKRVDVIIRSASKVMKKTDAQLLVVGNGECWETLIELASQLGIGERSSFPGFMDQLEEIPEVYQIASVFTTASEIETQGLVLLEALASGLPVVAVNATCIPEIIKHNINGFLTQPGDEVAIADRLFEILSDPSRASQMGRFGRLIAQGHAIKKTIDRHENLYRSITAVYQQAHSRKPVLLRSVKRKKIFRLYRDISRQLERNGW